MDRAKKTLRTTAAALTVSLSMAFAVPVCDYLDEPAALTDYADWPYTLVDTVFRLPVDYAPADLVPLTQAGFADERLIRTVVTEDLRELREAAAAAGNPVEVQSAYRSYAYQEQTFAYWVALEGREAALESSARPGHSEHQLGTAVDFRSAGGAAPWDLADWGETPAGSWMLENSWRYGFVVSYPAGTREITCYIYEPWHYRYVGREVAAQIQQSGLTPREWLWAYRESLTD